MKKLVVWLMILTMVLFGTAFADGIYPDLSQYTEEELKTLENLIQNELLLRGGVEYWFDYGFGQYIPKIKLVSGEEPIIKEPYINRNDAVFFSVTNIERGIDFDAYIDLLIANGYDEIIRRENGLAELKDGKGHKIKIMEYWNLQYINIDGNLYKVD